MTKESVYGEEIKEFTSTVVGLLDGDDLGLSYKVLDSEGNEVTLTDRSIVGTYTIKAEATNTNYNVTFTDGTYTIKKHKT